MPPTPPSLEQAANERWRHFIDHLADKGIVLKAKNTSADALKTGFALSRFACNMAMRHPELPVDLIDSGDLVTRYGTGDLLLRFQRHFSTGSGDASDGDLRKLWNTMGQTQFDQCLRTFRHRQMLRIAIRDLSGLADLEETLEDLTALADLCLEQSLDYLYRRQCLEWGTPMDGKHIPQQLVVLGMGKLGARELNFSSDVDLIFTYPRQGRTVGGAKSTTNEDFFLRLCRKLIKTVGGNTEDGFVFRVDTLLRPFGGSGPLVMSFGQMESYYETHGREWERYALIKARVAAGDKLAGQQLLDALKPFVFRRYLDYNAFESLRDMKARIAAEVRSKGLQDNIKLGPGGIREIEFFGQMFQLLRGGVHIQLQARGILTILQHLVANGYIPKATGEELKSAYIFLRRVENRIQAYMDQQRHHLPHSEEERLVLAAAMGFDDWTGFLATLDQHRRNVQHHFNALLEHGDAERSSKDDATDNLITDLSALWQGVFEEERAHAVLTAAGYEKPAKAMQLIEDLNGDAVLRSMSALGRDRLTKIMPLLLKTAGGTSNPQQVLDRLFDLVKSISRRTAYLSLLWEYPATIDQLVQLSEASPWISNLLSRHPVLLDELLDPRTLYSPPKRSDLASELRSRMAGIADEDFEHQLEAMRIFKQINTLRVAASDITNVLPLMKVSDRLSDIAEVVLNEVVDLSWQHLVAKHGSPACLLGDRKCRQGFAVIAYGKLGGLELGYRSDLDLVFLHAAAPGQTDGGPHPIDNAQFFARLGQRVLHILSAHTPAGILYETDMRLRPSGDSGMLVSHIHGFYEYQTSDAWTWEHQALIRARAITGDDELLQAFERIRMEILSQQRDSEALRNDVAAMRDKLRRAQPPSKEGKFDIKQGRGGIVDIEFLVQYLMLRHAHQYPEITRWTDNVRQLQSLSRHLVIDQQTAFGLRRAYLILRAMGHRLNLKGLPTQIDDNRFRGLRKHVLRCWDQYLAV
ncbi:MAG: bifunctional [glutamate--ammonia ligase]-adenylyl-L-tyrosine phosphorylase/[glutamate--ammonia-ligase] adenylyltransferase [Desulfobacteraceae bacterium]